MCPQLPDWYVNPALSPEYVFHRDAFEALTQQELLEALEIDGVYSKELKRATIGTSRAGVVQLSATPFHLNIYHVGPEAYVLVAGSLSASFRELVLT